MKKYFKVNNIWLCTWPDTHIWNLPHFLKWLIQLVLFPNHNLMWPWKDGEPSVSLLLGDWFHSPNIQLHLNSHTSATVWQSTTYLKISTAIYRKHPRIMVDTKPRIKWNYGKHCFPAEGKNEAPFQLLKDQEDTSNPGTISGFLRPNSFHEFFSGVQKNSAGCWWSVVHFFLLLIVIVRILKKI